MDTVVAYVNAKLWYFDQWYAWQNSSESNKTSNKSKSGNVFWAFLQ